jgi:hypothetical protein
LLQELAPEDPTLSMLDDENFNMTYSDKEIQQKNDASEEIMAVQNDGGNPTTTDIVMSHTPTPSQPGN